jgi:hypothetical protein
LSGGRFTCSTATYATNSQVKFIIAAVAEGVVDWQVARTILTAIGSTTASRVAAERFDRKGFINQNRAADIKPTAVQWCNSLFFSHFDLVSELRWGKYRQRHGSFHFRWYLFAFNSGIVFSATSIAIAIAIAVAVVTATITSTGRSTTGCSWRRNLTGALIASTAAAAAVPVARMMPSTSTILARCHQTSTSYSYINTATICSVCVIAGIVLSVTMILVMITLLLPVLLLLVVLCWQPRMTPRWIAAIFDAS